MFSKMCVCPDQRCTGEGYRNESGVLSYQCAGNCSLYKEKHSENTETMCVTPKVNRPKAVLKKKTE